MTFITSAPWAHQHAADAFVATRGDHALLAVPMGGGKSLAALMTMQRLDAHRVLILCPVSVLGVWRREFARHAPGAFTVCIPEGAVKAKADHVVRQMETADIRGDRIVVVLNYESARREPLDTVLTSYRWDLLVMDESHRIKSPFGTSSEFVGNLSRRCVARLGMTGTPTPHSPLDIFAQARAIDPDVFGWSYIAFRNRYAITHPTYKSKVLRWINQPEMQAKYRQLVYEVDLDGVLDVPEATDQTITVQLSSKARKLYDTLETELRVFLEDEKKATASNVLVKLLRLQEVTSGYLKTDDGVITDVDHGKENALADLLEDVAPDRPVVVFCRFLHDLDRIKDVAAIMGRTYGEISGRSKDALDEHACMRPSLTLVGVQIQSGGVGIDLTRASVAVYYSMGFSLGDYLQSRARLHRPGQHHHVAFVHLIAEHTVDQQVLDGMAAKQETVDHVLRGRFRVRAADAA